MPALQPKIIEHSEAAREGIARGLNKLANAVKVTLGPKGRLVVISRPYGEEVVTKDGVTVAKNIEFSDPLEQIGAKLVKSVAMKTVDEVGDGTTTATILAQALVREGMNLLRTGVDPQLLKREMERDLEVLISNLEETAIPISTDEEVLNIASISANDPELGKIVADAYKEVGRNGILTLEKSNGLDITVETVKGMRIDKGFVSANFVNDPDRMVSELVDVPVVLIDGELRHIHGILSLIDSIVKETGKKQMVVVAEDFSSEVLGTFLLNGSKGNFFALCIKSPGYGPERHREYLGDIAALTGATVLGDLSGVQVSEATHVHAGLADKVTATPTYTTIIGGDGDEKIVGDRVSGLQKELEQASWAQDKERLESRIAGLRDGIGVIKVGAETEVALIETYHRLEDAVHATRAAIDHGVVAGGGIALLNQMGGTHGLLNRVIDTPIKQIIQNTGNSHEIIINKLMEMDPGCGYDAKTGEFVDSMIDHGIIDPVKVTISALRSAVSIASLILCLDVAIYDEPKEKE